MFSVTVKRFFRAFAIGALIGAVVSTWFGPRGIAWYAEPPAYIGISCKPAIEWAFARFQWLQIFGVLGGGALASFLALGVFRKHKTLSPPTEESHLT